jgi:uncharacterized membrane protein YfcA
LERLRNANIGIAVGVTIAVVGAVAFRHSGEAALQLVGFLALVAALAAFMILDERDMRRKEKRPQ